MDFVYRMQLSSSHGRAPQQLCHFPAVHSCIFFWWRPNHHLAAIACCQHGIACTQHEPSHEAELLAACHRDCTMQGLANWQMRVNGMCARHQHV